MSISEPTKEAEMSGRRIGRLGVYWIAFKTGIYTLYYSSKVIWGSIFARNRRRYVDKALYDWSSALLGLVDVRVHVTGKENFPQAGKRPLIVMCNHSSLYDIPISAVALNTSLRMMAKKELFRIPVFSMALKRGEFLPIDRNNREQSLKDLAYAKQKMLDGIVLWVAPEGTRSKDGRLAKFKRGAFHVALESKALIVPIVVKDIHKVQPGKTITLNVDQDIEVEVLQAVDAANYNKETRKDLINAVHSRMLKALGQESSSNDR